MSRVISEVVDLFDEESDGSDKVEGWGKCGRGRRRHDSATAQRARR